MKKLQSQITNLSQARELVSEAIRSISSMNLNYEIAHVRVILNECLVYLKRDMVSQELSQVKAMLSNIAEYIDGLSLNQYEIAHVRVILKESSMCLKNIEI